MATFLGTIKYILISFYTYDSSSTYTPKIFGL